MQVTQVNDHVTHAVIGGKAAIEFGISNSAEFFNILSSTLYKDQILAVVREVLCNAWDAHIEAGCTDRPVEITLTADKFTIKDFGKGIHLDDMGPIYGTYGNSTKKNDGTQTGGFGLGCKAPFAYTDHFEVTSAHAGVKTIYNLSKSSAQAMGRPGIVPIASFASQESGLQVSIAVKNKVDHNRFKELVERIVHNGDMNMTLNGHQLDNLNFDTSKGNYLLTRDSSLISDQPRIMVRYGNVMYPVSKNNEISEKYNAIVTHMDRLKCGHNGTYYIVFQAPPHSIAVTPSRESLSMSGHTVTTLNKLFDDFLESLHTRFNKVCDTYAEVAVKHAVDNAEVAQLLRRDAVLPGSMEIFEPFTISDLDTMAKRYMVANYPKGLDFRKMDIKRRLGLMAQEGLLDRGIVQTYLRDLEKVTTLPQSHAWDANKRNTDWLQKQVLGPLVTKLANAGIDHKKLYVCDPEDSNTPDRYNRKNYPPITPAISARPLHLFGALPYLRNIVVISVALTDLVERAYQHAVFKELGEYPGYLFYQASRKVTEKDAALEFFKKSGMTVVDLTAVTVSQSFIPSRRFIASTTPRKPTKKGLVVMSSILTKDGINTALSREDDAARIIAPEFVVSISLSRDQSNFSLPHWDSVASRYIVDLIGAKGGVTNNSAVHKKWMDKGAKDFKAYLQEKMFGHMMTSPAIREFWEFNPKRVIEEAPSRLHDMIELVYSNADLRAHYQLVNNLTVVDQKYLYLWEYYANLYRRHTPEEALKVKAYLNSIKMSPLNAAMVKQLHANPLLEMIDEDGFKSIMHPEEDSPPIPHQVKKKALEILVTVLKN